MLRIYWVTFRWPKYIFLLVWKYIFFHWEWGKKKFFSSHKIIIVINKLFWVRIFPIEMQSERYFFIFLFFFHLKPMFRYSPQIQLVMFDTVILSTKNILTINIFFWLYIERKLNYHGTFLDRFEMLDNWQKLHVSCVWPRNYFHQSCVLINCG